MFEQAVAAGQKKAVEIARARAVLAHLDAIDADPDRAQHALGPQLLQCGIGTLHRLAKAARLLVAVIVAVDVVDQRDVDLADPKPLKASVDRAHDTIVAVIVENLERQSFDVRARILSNWQRLEQSPNLGGKHIGVAPDMA